HRVELVRVRLLRLGISPRALPRERTILWPDPVRQRERSNLVARYRRIDRHHVACDLFLHDGVAEFVEPRVPDCVITQLETLVGEPLHLLEAPFFLLAMELG